MSEVVLNAGESVTSQVIEDLAPVSVDKSKLAALNTETGSSDLVEVEVTSGTPNCDKSEIHRNGTTQNGNKSDDQTANTNCADNSNHSGNDEITQASTDENPAEALVTCSGTEAGSTPADEAKTEDQSNTESTTTTSTENTTPEQGKGDGSTETSCDATEPTTESTGLSETATLNEAPRSSEATESPAKKVSAEGQTDDDEVTVNQQMKDLHVESAAIAKEPSPGKKSCSPF